MVAVIWVAVVERIVAGVPPTETCWAPVRPRPVMVMVAPAPAPVGVMLSMIAGVNVAPVYSDFHWEPLQTAGPTPSPTSPEALLFQQAAPAVGITVVTSMGRVGSETVTP
ncbi:hypothetical protein ABE10_01510, partial [Bacillus toyonensis]|nr:hypothetical protein [Bacillus toyonensis]